MSKLLLILFILFCIPTTLILAENDKAEGKDKHAHRFAKQDKNSDGKIDLEEFLGHIENDEKREKKTKIFNKFDSNSDGALTKEEMKSHKHNRGDRFKKRDTNQDGQLSLNEFTEGLDGKKAERANQLFAKLDSNGDGNLSKDEMHKGKKVHHKNKKERKERKGKKEKE